MLKTMLQKFAAKVLSFAMVGVLVAAPFVSQTTHAADEATLNVALNINETGAGFVILDTGNGNKTIINEDASKCTPMGKEFVCTYKLPTGSYVVQYKQLGGYITPGDSPALLSQQTGNMTVHGNYIKKENKKLNVVLNINETGAGFNVLDTGNGNKVVSSKTAKECTPNGSDFICTLTNLPTGAYVVQYTDAPGYTTPKDSPALLSEQFGDMTVHGIYTKKENPTLSVGVNINEEGAGFRILNTGNGNDVIKTESAKNCALANDNYYTCSYTLPTGAYVVQYTNAIGYTTPKDSPALISDQTGDMKVKGDYLKQDTGNVNFQVLTRDNQGNSLNEQYIRNALTTHTTPHSFSEPLANLNSYSFQFKNKPGYTTPGTVIVSNKMISSLPSNVTVLENGATYALGTTFKPNATYTITGTYVKTTGDLYTLNKQASEILLADGNKQVDYTITVTRNANGPAGVYNIVVDDSVNDQGNRTIYGTNGGSMKVVPVNGSYSKCSNNCGDITLSPVNVTTTQPGQVVTITYRMKSDKTGIPANQTSNFTNTVVGNYVQDGQNKTTSDQVTVTVPDEGTEADLFTVTKTATEQVLANGNKRVTYQIIVRRNLNGPSGTYYILVDDTVNDNGNRTLYGSNGGTMTVVKRTDGTYSTCSNNCGDITAGPVNVKTTSPNDVVTLTYEMVSDNSTIPNNQTSNFGNTALGKYTQDGQNKTTSGQATVTVGKNIYVPAPAPTPTPGPAPISPTPVNNAKTGPGGMLILLILSGLGAYAWQTVAKRRKAALIK